MRNRIVRSGGNLLTALEVPPDLWIARRQPLSGERVEDGRDHSRHDAKQQERGNEAHHQREDAAYADRPSPHLEPASPCLASCSSVVPQAFHH